MPLRSCVPRGTMSRVASAVNSQLTGTVRGHGPSERWEKVDGARGEGQVHSEDKTDLIAD